MAAPRGEEPNKIREYVVRWFFNVEQEGQKPNGQDQEFAKITSVTARWASGALSSGLNTDRSPLAPFVSWPRP